MAKCLIYSLFVLNMLCLLAGLAVLGIGFWVIFEGQRFVTLLEASLLSTAAYMLIAVGGFVSLVAMLGCCGAVKESKFLLGTYFACLLFVCLLQAAAAVLCFMFLDNIKGYPDKYVGDAILERYDLPNNDLITHAIDAMHQKFQCCGYKSPLDWAHSQSFNHSNAAVPISCCINQNQLNCNQAILPTKIYTKGCVEPLLAWLKTKTLVIAAVAIAVVFIQMVGLVFAMCVCQQAGQVDLYA